MLLPGIIEAGMAKHIQSNKPTRGKALEETFFYRMDQELIEQTHNQAFQLSGNAFLVISLSTLVTLHDASDYFCQDTKNDRTR